MLEFKYLINHKKSERQKVWETSGSNEYGISIQGIRKSIKLKYRIKGMNSINLIRNQLVPKQNSQIYKVCGRYTSTKQRTENNETYYRREKIEYNKKRVQKHQY